MIELLQAANKGEKNEKYTFYLDGDLCQMSAQRSFLNNHGVSTMQNNVYPCVRESDIENAMRLIWENRVDGWWHYEEKYVKFGICTSEEFTKRLMRS